MTWLKVLVNGVTYYLSLWGDPSEVSAHEQNEEDFNDGHDEAQAQEGYGEGDAS